MKNCSPSFSFVRALSLMLVLFLSSPARAELVAHWTFEPGEELVDLAGNFPDLSLQGDAVVADGALDLNGSGTNASGWAYTTGGSYAGPDIGNKSLVSWVSVQSPSTTAAAGSALTLDRVGSDQFDGIIFAERETNRWMNGSNGFSRTPDNGFLDGVETATDGATMVVVAITYQDVGAGQVEITGYRNGAQIGQYTSGNFASWTTGDAEVIFGKRHGNPATAGPGALDALVHEARIYDTALTLEEIQALQLTITADSDGDGLDDSWEQAVIDSDPDDAIEALADVNPGDDLDGDRLTNLQEFQPPQTDPLDADSDDDNLEDDIERNTRIFVDAGDTGTNPNDPDTDGDNLQDDVETGTGNYVSASNTGTNPNIADSDGDGIDDDVEIAGPFSDPNDPDDPPPPPFEGSLIGHWTFEAGSELVDLAGNFPDLSLEGDAQVIDGALDVNGAGTTASGWAYTAGVDGYTGPVIGEKTLVSWVTLQALADVAVAGSALTLDKVASDQFDGIIFAEQQTNRWMNGSNGFERTMAFAPGFEEAAVGEPVMVAITYEDLGAGGVRITGYRNGEQIGQYDDTPFATWSPGDAEVIFGKRHGFPATAGPGALDALIDEARIYGAAATPGQIMDLFNAGPGSGGDPLRFTAIVYDEGAGEAIATWVSKVGKTYRIEWSPDLKSPIWVEEDDSYPTGGATSDRTAFSYGIPPGTQRRYFRVTEEP